MKAIVSELLTFVAAVVAVFLGAPLPRPAFAPVEVRDWRPRR